MNAPEHRWTSLPRWSVSAAVWLAALAAVLAWVLSYSSQVVLAAQHGYPAWQAALWPLTTDLVSLALMIVAMDAADTKRRGATVRTACLTILGAGVMVTGNAIVAWPDQIAIAMHTWPPLIGAALWYVLAHDRPRRAVPDWTSPRPSGGRRPLDMDAGHGQSTPVLSGPAVQALPAARVTLDQYREARRTLGPDATHQQLADHLSCSTKTIQRLAKQDRESARPRVVTG